MASKPKPAPVHKLTNTPSIIPQPRHPATGKFQPKGDGIPNGGIYKAQGMPYNLTSTNGT